MKKFLLAFALAVVPFAASAADLMAPVPVPPPVAVEPAPIARWTGLHLGIGIGAVANTARVRSATDITFYDDCDGPCFRNSYRNSGDVTKYGVFGTLEAGYDFQFDRFVLGVGANYDLSQRTKGSISAQERSFYAGSAQKSSVEFGDSWAVYARAGWLATDKTLLYALGGYANQDVKMSSSIWAGDERYFYDATKWSGGKKLDGYVVGVGAEQMLTQNISLKLEYRFADFGKLSTKHSFSNDNCDCDFYRWNSRASADITTQSIRAVLSYRF